MFQLTKSFVSSCLLALVAFGSTPKIGDRAPQFSLPGSDGRTVALKDYAGKKLVLVFYRGYW
jgi:peroxiredoxin